MLLPAPFAPTIAPNFDPLAWRGRPPWPPLTLHCGPSKTIPFGSTHMGLGFKFPATHRSRCR
jgi:hypothetical protein